MAKLFLQKKWNRSSVPKIEQLGWEGFLVAKPKADYQRAGNLLLLLPKRAWCSRWERRGFLLECRPPGQNPHQKSANSLQHANHTCAVCRGALPGHATWRRHGLGCKATPAVAALRTPWRYHLQRRRLLHHQTWRWGFRWGHVSRRHPTPFKAWQSKVTEQLNAVGVDATDFF